MLEPVTINDYSSPRAFHLYDTVWGPHALVLHSFGGKFLGDAIDLIFLNTDYVSLPFELRGVLVRAHNPSLSLRPLLGDDLAAREAFIISTSKNGSRCLRFSDEAVLA